MANALKLPSCPQYCRSSTSWFPLSSKWPTVVFNQNFGLPPLMEPQDFGWMESTFLKLGSSSWQGYFRSPTYPHAPEPRFSTQHRELSAALSEADAETCTWRISLDVSHFAPSEICIKIQHGFLEISAKHEERLDEHGYIARCFTRKYKLPSGVDVETLKTCLSSYGILTVEAPLPRFPLSTDVIIPIQVEKDPHNTVGKQQDGGKLQYGIKPELLEGEKPESSASVRDEIQQDQVIYPSREPKLDESGISAPGRVPTREARGSRKNKEATVQEAVDGTKRDGEEFSESVDEPQAAEAAETISSQPREQAEVNQPPVLMGEEGFTGPAVMEDEQSTFGQTQEMINPQLVLQEKIDVETL